MRPPRRQAVAPTPHQPRPVASGRRPPAAIACDRPHSPERRPHPTATRIARAAILIGSGGGAGVPFSALLASGFTVDQLVEHLPAAEAILSGATS